ncbi:MAG: glycosyltransferase [Bacteroidetes bacterium]|nr:glycosyltransferase [Bacteroidota bacterium]
MLVRKINVVHIITSLPLGGAENVVYTLAKNIDRSKFNVIVCCLDDEGYIAEKLKEEGFLVYCVRERFRYRWRQVLNLYKLFKREKIDIVHTHLFKADFWGRLIAFIAGVPVICKSEHTVQHPMKFGVWSLVRPPFYNIVKILGINAFLDYRSKAILYVCDYGRRSFLGRKINPQKHFVVYNGLNLERQYIVKSKQDLKNEFGFSNTNILITIIGRLVERKGHKYLLEAFRMISDKYPQSRLLVVGSGPAETELKELSKKIGKFNEIYFLGERENVDEFLKISDVFILPSWREALSIVLLEAMYYGLPVIAGDDGGTPELIEDNVNGILVPVRNSDAIENAIENMINNPQKRKQMIVKAKETVLAKFSETIMTRQYEQIYLSFARRNYEKC